MIISYVIFFYQEKFKVTNVTDMFENSIGFSCNIVCLKFFWFLKFFFLGLFIFIYNFFNLKFQFFFSIHKLFLPDFFFFKRLIFLFFSFFSLYIFIYHSKYYKLICMPCTMR